MSRACHGEETTLPSDQRATAYNACMQAQQTALTELNKKWAQFPAAAKQPCAMLARTFDSYVELLVCIQIRAGNGLTNPQQK
jgi:hypothetical protein